MTEKKIVQDNFRKVFDIDLSEPYEDLPIFDIISKLSKISEDAFYWEHFIRSVYAFAYTFDRYIIESDDPCKFEASNLVWAARLLDIFKDFNEYENITVFTINKTQWVTMDQGHINIVDINMPINETILNINSEYGSGGGQSILFSFKYPRNDSIREVKLIVLHFLLGGKILMDCHAL